MVHASGTKRGCVAVKVRDWYFERVNTRSSSVRKQVLVAEVLELSQEDRIDLLLELLDSLAPDPEAEAKWMVEVRRRHAEVRAGSAKLTSWEQVRSRLLGG